MDPNAKDSLNLRVKRREGFRPYAPSVLRQECAQWFDLDESPYMLLEAAVRPEKRHLVPGIVHVDGTSRPQTVTEEANPKYYRLISEFFERTGVPMVLNTSFNRHGEPIVNRPEDAIAVLIETDLDELFIGDYHIRRRDDLPRASAALNSGIGGIGEEIRGLFAVADFVVHNRARVSGSVPLVVSTEAQPWSYAVAFPLRDVAMKSVPAADGILIRIGMSVEAGRVGAILVGNDLRTAIGGSAERSAGDGLEATELTLETSARSGWLILRNNSVDGVPARCTVRSIHAFPARRSGPR